MQKIHRSHHGQCPDPPPSPSQALLTSIPTCACWVIPGTKHRITENHRRREVSHQLHAPTSVSRAAPKFYMILYVFTFRCALGRNKTMKARDTFWWEGTVWARMVFTAPVASPPTLVRCPLLPYLLGGHLPTLVKVYW